MKTDKKLVLILDQSVLDKYNEYYFSLHPKAKKIPIDKPRHPSINQWCIFRMRCGWTAARRCAGSGFHRGTHPQGRRTHPAASPV